MLKTINGKKVMRLPNTQSGFSLLELLAVVAIVGIIATLSIPRLLAARRAANEASAQSSQRVIHSCELTYQATTGQGDFASLATLNTMELTDTVLGSGNKSGYRFAATPSAAGVRPAQFYATAVPIITSGPGQTGTRRFGITEDGVGHGDTVALTAYANGAAIKAAPVVGNW